MIERADAVVVGGGVIGTSVAYLLAKEGLEVCILEREAIASGATGHGHGLINLVGNDFRPGAHFALGLACARVYPEFTDSLLEDSGVDPNYHELQGLSFAVVEEEELIFRSFLERPDTQANVEMRWVGIEEAREIEPRLTPDGIGGILYSHGQVDAPRMTLAAARATERMGGHVLLREATGITRENGRVTGVSFKGGHVAAPTVVLAGGAWMGAAGSWVDFPIPVRPRHGEVLHARLAGDPIRMFILTARHGPIAPRRDGVLMIGSVGGVTMGGASVDDDFPFDPADTGDVDFDLEPKRANRFKMIDLACRVMPALEEAEFIAHLAGVRPLSADRLPLIGPVPGVEGAFLATGHGTKGIHLAPVTAHIVADAVLGRPRDDVPTDAFLPDRFASYYNAA
jgi:glycine/D-amino acid oxidase-like deaminating enzyme